MEIVRVQHLTKNFADIRAVDDLSFSVEQGSVYGFLGQNGAGKSTTIRMLLTLVRPTAGDINIFGKALHKNRRATLQQIGAIIEKPDLYNYLSAKDNLRMMAQLSGIRLHEKEVMRQLARVGIETRAGSMVKTFSQGMKQRLAIACALAHNPKLLILDEPTNGLDPQGITDVRNLILHLSKNEGKTVIVSSHLLNEIEMMADAMLIIDRGKKVAEGKVNELLHPALTLIRLETANDAHTLALLKQSAWAETIRPGGAAILLQLHRNRVPELLNDLVKQGVAVFSVQSKHALEDYFLSLTSGASHVEPYHIGTV